MRSSSSFCVRQLPVQLTVMLDDGMGSLYELLDFLSRSSVETLGVSVQDCHEVKIARIIVDDPDLAQTILRKKGYSYTTHHVVVVALREGPHDIIDLVCELKKAETMVSAVYGLLIHPGDYALVALCVNDPDFAGKVLLAHGERVMTLKDLCC